MYKIICKCGGIKSMVIVFGILCDRKKNSSVFYSSDDTTNFVYFRVRHVKKISKGVLGKTFDTFFLI